MKTIRRLHVFRRSPVAIAGLCAALAAASGAVPAQAAGPSTPPSASADEAAAAPTAVAPPPDPADPAGPDRVTDPDRVLGPHWRTAADRGVTTSTDETGLHLLVADRRDGYHWRTAATLAEPGIDTDQWIGQYCVTGSQRRAVVVYAPRQYANQADLMTGGAFAAIVDLDSGTVTKLAERVSLAYYNPACNAGETAVVSALTGDEKAPRTRITVIDTATGKTRQSHTLRGQVTSPTVVGGDLYAASGSGVVRVRNGGTTLVAPTRGTPYRLTSDGAGALTYELNDGKTTRFDRLAGGRVRPVATAPVGAARLRPGAAGKVFVVGDPAGVRWSGSRPSGWQSVDAPVDSEVSGLGELTVLSASSHTEAAASSSGAAVDGEPDQVGISARLTGGAALKFSLRPSLSSAGTRSSPGLPSSAAAAPKASSLAATDPSTTPWDLNRTCAVPRNDPAIQVYQPTPKQVEWAADLASHGQLNITRAANWLNSGLPQFSPQSLFTPMMPKTQAGETRWLPAQVLLGVLAQESNLRQASWHVTDGSSGNPLTSSGFYALNKSQDPNSIGTGTYDCGYGVGQITSGMRTIDTNAAGGLTDLQQKAVVIDYATNIAASAHMLEQAWADLQAAHIIANNGDPQFIENWFFAVWAYNTGLHPNTGNGPWGLGWVNNPANPLFPADRHPYLVVPLDTPTHNDNIGYDNAKHPSDWSYPERIMGWAHKSVILPDYLNGGNWTSTYQTGLWPPGDTTFVDAQPGHNIACVATINHCDPAAPPHKPAPPYDDQPAGPCQIDDLTYCWWHESVQWVDCTQLCGGESRVYTAVEPRPYATNIHPEECSTTKLPAGARIVDDLMTSDNPTGNPQGPNGCWGVTRGGTFSLKFADKSGAYPSKVDFHQIGAGFGGHFWFTHTQTQTPSTQSLKVTGTWTPGSSLTGWAQVMVHIPDEGAWTQQAHYVIHTGNGPGTDRDRFISMNRAAKDTWIELGTYRFGTVSQQGLELSNFTGDGQGNQDIAWDAAAFVPLTQKPRHMVVAIGDSYQSGEGSGAYDRETDLGFDTYYWNACRRSSKAWPRLIKLPGQTSGVGTLADKFDPSLDFQFVSCSGATAEKMTDTSTKSYWTNTPDLESLHGQAEGQFFEKNQVDSGVLSADTTLVLLSAGGNDAGFPDVLAQCGRTDCTLNRAAYEQKIRDAQLRTATLIQQVHTKASNARIVLVGYPKIFAERHGRTCALFSFSDAEMTMLNELADQMRTEQSAMVGRQTQSWTSGTANFVDMIAGFGNHGACMEDETSTPPPTVDINDLVIGQTGPGDFEELDGVDVEQCDFTWLPGNDCASRSSFHPKPSGAVRQGDAVTNALVAIGYQ
ncbi:SGNH/GDSL hydrolase family protein [Paractinoplanes globisporus]|uniref:SGNH/GDSL hydrolase family protein n=1 Tax=Paractinoplanes globisporus TaxID=113565 RepID=A0ABW6WNE9_9ACTN|nr:SGNH/GDSL hydrolase family protein [Actinoplanes globisporus]